MSSNDRRFNWVHATQAYEFELHKRLIDEMADNINEAHDELSNRIQKNWEDFLSGPELAGHESAVEDRHHELNHFDRVLMNSLLVSSVSLFEFRLFQTCERAKNLSRNPISVGDWGNFSMDRAKLYLGRLGVDVPASSDEWKEVKNIQKVRNAIVHRGGILRPESDVVDYAVEQNIVDDSDKDGPRVILATRAYCKGSLDTLRSLWVSIDRSTDDNFAQAVDE